MVKKIMPILQKHTSHKWSRRLPERKIRWDEGGSFLFPSIHHSLRPFFLILHLGLGPVDQFFAHFISRTNARRETKICMRKKVKERIKTKLREEEGDSNQKRFSFSLPSDVAKISKRRREQTEQRRGQPEREKRKEVWKRFSLNIPCRATMTTKGREKEGLIGQKVCESHGWRQRGESSLVKQRRLSLRCVKSSRGKEVRRHPFLWMREFFTPLM